MTRRAWRACLVAVALGTAACSAIIGIDGEVVDPLLDTGNAPDPGDDDSSTRDAAHDTSASEANAASDSADAADTSDSADDADADTDADQ